MLCVVLNCSGDAYFWFKLAAWGRLPSSRMYVNGHYNPLVRIMTQFLTPLMQCMSILYMSGGTQSLIESIHFLEFAQQFFIYCQSFYQKSVERKSPQKYFLFFIQLVMSGQGCETRPTHYLLDCGDFDGQQHQHYTTPSFNWQLKVHLMQ